MLTIKEGTSPSHCIFVGTCSCCGWQAEAYQKELNFDGDYWYGCPTKGCGQRVCFYCPPQGGSGTAPAEKYIDRSGLKYEGGEQ